MRPRLLGSRRRKEEKQNISVCIGSRRVSVPPSPSRSSSKPGEGTSKHESQAEEETERASERPNRFRGAPLGLRTGKGVTSKRAERIEEEEEEQGGLKATFSGKRCKLQIFTERVPPFPPTTKQGSEREREKERGVGGIGKGPKPRKDPPPPSFLDSLNCVGIFSQLTFPSCVSNTLRSTLVTMTDFGSSSSSSAFSPRRLSPPPPPPPPPPPRSLLTEPFEPPRPLAGTPMPPEPPPMRRPPICCCIWAISDSSSSKESKESWKDISNIQLMTLKLHLGGNGKSPRG